MTDTYEIRRHFFLRPGETELIESGLTLEEAQAHCSDPATSSQTARGREARDYYGQVGPWFDGYTKED